MLDLVRSFRRSLPLLSGAAFGLTLTLWTTVHASALLPGLFLTSVTNGTVVSGVVPLTASANAAGFASLQFQVSGQNVGPTITSGSCVTAWDTRSFADGVHTVTALATDTAGNTVSATPVVVTVVNLATGDTTPPSVTLTSPAAGSTVSGTITLTAAATDNVGIAGVWFMLDGTILGSEISTPQASLSWNTMSATNGLHVLAAAARDTSGNATTSAGITVTVSNATTDTTPPTVALTAPAAGAVVSGSVVVAANASDNVGVSSVQFTLDGFALGLPDTVAPYQTTWNAASAANGTHTLGAVAQDGAGNTTTAATRTVTVNNVIDTVAPTVALTAPAAGTTVSGTVTVSASASDAVGVTSVQFLLDGANLGAADTSSPYQVTWTTTGTSNGPHVLGAVALDAAGNMGTAATRTVTVSNVNTDPVAPTVSITAPINGTTVSGSVTISATASDNVGVAGVQFRIDGVNLGAEDTAAPYQIAWTTSSSPNGSHVITAVARDAAGNTKTASTTVVIKNLGSGVAGDFNGDGYPDLLFQNSNGQLYVWFMAGGELIGERPLSPASVDPAWQIVGTDDFDGDRKTDILWQNANSGQVYIWYMDGATMTSSAALPSVGSDWRISATGDLNGDGMPDIIWRHQATGQVYVWIMNGVTVSAQGLTAPAAVDLTWRIAGAADLNHDGRSDLVWQNMISGALYVWYMDGLVSTQTGSLTPSAASPTWQLKGVADFDKDGEPDLVWEHSTSGQLYMWFLTGSALSTSRYVSPSQVNVTWQIVGGK